MKITKSERCWISVLLESCRMCVKYLLHILVAFVNYFDFICQSLELFRHSDGRVDVGFLLAGFLYFTVSNIFQK